MRPALSLPLLLATAACGAVPGTDTYSCGGLPVGVSCISARDTYKLTDSGRPVIAVAGKATALPPAAAEGAAPARPAAAPPMAAAAPTTTADPLEPGLLARIALRPEQAGAPDVIPLRAPPTVLRIWIAPWEDTLGRLHVPGYTYAEIEPRRWSIGQGQPGQRRQLQPLPPDPQPPLPQAASQRPAPPPEMLEASGQGPAPRRQLNPPPRPRGTRDGDVPAVPIESFAPSY